MSCRGGMIGAWLGLLALVDACDLGSSSRTDGALPSAGSGSLSSAAGRGGADGTGAGNAGQSASSGALGMALAGAGAGAASGAGVAGAPAAAPGQLRDFLGDPGFPDSFWQPAGAGESQVDPAPL